MEKFTIKIQLGNDAMRSEADIANALRDIAGKIFHGHISLKEPNETTIRDENGNRIGSVAIT